MKIRLFILLLALLATTANLRAQNPVNPASVDVNNLSDAQIDRIIREIQSRGLSQDEAVALARELAQSGDAVLLSPACASFDMFRNYEHRAQVFREAVQALARAAGSELETLA